MSETRHRHCDSCYPCTRREREPWAPYFCDWCEKCKEPDEVDVLKARVAALEKRLEALENEIRKGRPQPFVGKFPPIPFEPL